MQDTLAANPPWRRGVQALRAAWQPLIVYELLAAWIATAAVGPLLLTAFYRLVELSGEAVVGSSDLARFWLTPLGAASIVLGLSVLLGLAWIEFAGLVLLVDAALRGHLLSLRQLLATLATATPRLCGLAVSQVSLAIAVALPFVALAGGVYWLLLSGTDINFYLAERPPRFWLAVALGSLLAIGLTGALAWIFARWALAVPRCVLDGQGWLAALRTSQIRMRGRAGRLLLLVGTWQAAKYLVLLLAVAGLDRLNDALAARFSEQLSWLLWSTVGLLLVDTIVLQLIGAAFTIGLAVLVANEYERAKDSGALADRPAPAASTVNSAPAPSWRARLALVALAVVLPLASLATALAAAHASIDHRPTLVTAHRAGPKTAPENSIAALQLSLAIGADFVEIDVQQTADGQVVLMHDRDLRRVTGDPRVLNATKLADLADLRLRLDGQPTDEPIPTLAEFLAACDDRIRINVELKEFGDTPDLGPAVVKVLTEAGFLDRARLTSFHLPPLLAARKVEPALPIGMILSASKGDLTRLPVDLLSLHQRMVRADLVRRAHRQGMEVHAWTVNDRPSALRLLDLGCDNLITSDPAMAREAVDWYASLGDVERMLLRLRRWMRD